MDSISISSLKESLTALAPDSLTEFLASPAAANAAKLVLPVVATVVFYGAFHFVQALYNQWNSPLRNMPGPPNPSFFMGNIQELMDDYETGNRWRKQFGHIFKFKSLMSVDHVHVQDVKAISHILANNNTYQKAPFGMWNTKRTLGTGLLAVEGVEHKRQRKILNQAFAPSQIRLLTETFLEKSVQCRDMWISEEFSRDPKAEGHVIDVFDWYRKLTLDIIGAAGFNYDMNALQPEGTPNELNDVLTRIFHAAKGRMLMGITIMQAMVPILRLVPFPGTGVFKECKATTFKIGGEILAKAKSALGKTDSMTEATGQRSVLAALLKANMNPDVAPEQRMSDEEVIAQIPTLIIAGHESTSSSASWAISQLAGNPRIQEKLREELFTLSDNPTMDELNGLPYLEQVVRESMRLYPALVFTMRMAMQDDVLPLGKPYVDPKGKVHDSLLIPKGQVVHMPLIAVHTDPEIWGADADVFNPERWENIPDAVKAIPGVYANTLTFLGGTHACIGYRFAIAEMKSILFVSVRTFEFSHVKPGSGPVGGMVRKTAMIPGGSMLQHPMDSAAPEKGSAAPIMVKLLNRAY
ncbi:cytochrome P450 [Mycena amicta]|nr:cytochrome P450 [Mycena amicta]